MTATILLAEPSKIHLRSRAVPEKTPSLGEHCWNDTTVILTGTFQQRRYRNLFTGETFSADSNILLSQEFALLPVSLLVAE